mmetsp:Transcript_13400/g.17355  ORF Transcript_13400/g.17355 Transcript_13400/m.17355 type:complete len:445 (-) Transcript_13400:132-1466(-)
MLKTDEPQMADVELAGFDNFPTRESEFDSESSTNLRSSLDSKKTMTLECPVLPCWDEDDDGVPPPCRGDDPACWKVFNHQNQYTNDNLCCIAFGNVGFHYFDKGRQTWMGIAMWSTLISIAFTIAGCFALSTNQGIVLNTHWLVVFARNKTSGDEFTLHLGLRSLVHTHDPCTPFGCHEDSFLYSCDSDGNDCWPNEFVADGLGDCRKMAASTAFGAFTTCATLLFALLGTINRMKFSSDANIQKALGMITDLFCASIPQAITMRDFYRRCYAEIDLNYKGEVSARVYLGPGYWCYIICLFGACMRALFHWLTPLPNQGSGCKPQLPQSLIDLLDEDGDGEISWDEMKKGYSKLVAARREKKKQQQLMKEGNWQSAKKNGKQMVKANTDTKGSRSSGGKLIDRISESDVEYGIRSKDSFTQAQEGYVSKKDYEQPVFEAQPTSL